MGKESTKEAIMEVASELFFKHGFRRISIEDICRKAGIVRKTFYEYYSNKIELVKCVLDNYIDQATCEYIEIMKRDIEFSEKINLIIDMKMEASKGFTMEFMEDLFSPKNIEMTTYFEQKEANNKSMVYNFYVNAQKNGEIRSDIPIDIIIEMQNNLCELCKSEEFRSKFNDFPTMLKQVSELYLFGVIKRNN